MINCSKKLSGVNIVIYLALALLLTLALSGSNQKSGAQERTSYIIQADSLAEAQAAVLATGGQLTHKLAIIDAVGADLTAAQAAQLRQNEALTLSANQAVATAGFHVSSPTPAFVGAAELHGQHNGGQGVTVAILDTGHQPNRYIEALPNGQSRVGPMYNAITDEMQDIHHYSDESGHGTHITSIILGSAKGSRSHLFNAIAPGAELVSVKAFDANGAGTYLDIIRGMDWIINHKDEYGIRVLNLSFAATPQSYYWDDPLNQAVMRAWQEGIVVVVAAGNSGPDPMTIGVPGNVPYVITVGAMSDNYTPLDRSDDFITSFSAAGPTVEGFVKPDVIAPGGHIAGFMMPETNISQQNPSGRLENMYYQMSGTSQATAVVSGIVALMLHDRPDLTPDAVKCRLMASAMPALTADGELAYSVFQQGAGLIDAVGAVASEALNCANQGLDIAADLAGTQHFQGQANMDDAGNYVVGSDEGLVWSGGSFWAGGFAWSEGSFWAGGFAWSEGSFWAGGFAWSESYLFAETPVWSASLAGISQWVPQE